MANDDRPPEDGTGPSDRSTESNVIAGPMVDLDSAGLWLRLQSQLAQLRSQVQRLNQALAAVDRVRATVPTGVPAAPTAGPAAPPTAAPPATAAPRSASPSPLPSRGPATSVATDRATEPAADPATHPATGHQGRASPRLFSNRRRGDRRWADRGNDRRGAAGEPIANQPSTPLAQSVPLEIGTADLEALIRAGFLLRRDSHHPDRVAKAIQQLLIRWRYATFGPDEPAVASPGASAGDRRSGRERRREAPRSNCLLSYVKNTGFDRRRGERRKANGAQGATFGKRNRPRPFGTLIRLGEVRAARALRGCAPDAEGTAQGVGGVERKADPGQGERQPVKEGDRLTENKQRQEKVTGGRDVLEKTHGHQPDPPRTSDEEDQR